MIKKQILKLRPKFKFGEIIMIDWFEIFKIEGYYSIKSGLRHPDSVTKSPYFYNSYSIGKNAKKEELEKFTKW